MTQLAAVASRTDRLAALVRVPGPCKIGRSARRRGRAITGGSVGATAAITPNPGGQTATECQIRDAAFRLHEIIGDRSTPTTTRRDDDRGPRPVLTASSSEAGRADLSRITRNPCRLRLGAKREKNRDDEPHHAAARGDEAEHEQPAGRHVTREARLGRRGTRGARPG